MFASLSKSKRIRTKWTKIKSNVLQYCSRCDELTNQIDDQRCRNWSKLWLSIQDANVNGIQVGVTFSNQFIVLILFFIQSTNQYLQADFALLAIRRLRLITKLLFRSIGHDIFIYKRGRDRFDYNDFEFNYRRDICFNELADVCAKQSIASRNPLFKFLDLGWSMTFNGVYWSNWFKLVYNLNWSIPWIGSHHASSLSFANFISFFLYFISSLKCCHQTSSNTPSIQDYTFFDTFLLNLHRTCIYLNNFRYFKFE